MLLSEAGIHFDKVVAYAEDKDMPGNEVWGLLPHRMSAMADSYVELILEVPKELHGCNLGLVDLRKCKAKMIRYNVTKEDLL